MDQLFDRIVPTEGALRLLETFTAFTASRWCSPPPATPTSPPACWIFLEGNHLLEDRITGSDAERSKPSGALVEVALSSVDADHAVVVGDATWDLYAARDAGVRGIGLLTGGFAEAQAARPAPSPCTSPPPRSPITSTSTADSSDGRLPREGWASDRPLGGQVAEMTSRSHMSDRCRGITESWATSSATGSEISRQA